MSTQPRLVPMWWLVCWKTIWSSSDILISHDPEYRVKVTETYYRKFPKYSHTQKICCNHSKIWTRWLYHRVMSPNDADGGAVWSGSTLFAQAYLSENLASLW